MGNAPRGGRRHVSLGRPSNQDKIRKNLGKLASEIKAREFCLVVEPTTRQFKIYEGTEIEKQYVLSKQGFWEARGKRADDWSEYLTDLVTQAAPSDPRE